LLLLSQFGEKLFTESAVATGHQPEDFTAQVGRIGDCVSAGASLLLFHFILKTLLTFLVGNLGCFPGFAKEGATAFLISIPKCIGDASLGACPQDLIAKVARIVGERDE